jgi:5-methylcytosine-specific restriction endonuclease McrA
MTPKHKQAIKIFTRDSFRCQYCGQYFSPDQPPLHRHHRIFTSQGGQDDEDNLATCCWKCHYDHGKLKGAKLITEKDFTKIEELKKRYVQGLKDTLNALKALPVKRSYTWQKIQRDWKK